MAVPNFLATPFRYLELLLVTDVDAIVSGLRAELVECGWTETLAGTFRSPARADGIFFTVAVAKVSATRLSLVVRDLYGAAVNNQSSTTIEIDAGGTAVRLYTGPLHLCVDSSRAAPECFACGIADQTPEEIASPRAVFWATRGPRDGSGSAGYQAWHQFWILKAGTAAYAGSDCGGARKPWTGQNESLTMSGALMFAPVELQSEGWLYGRLHQALLAPQGPAVQGAEFQVPIDVGVTGVFKVVGLTAWAYWKLAFRKG